MVPRIHTTEWSKVAVRARGEVAYRNEHTIEEFLEDVVRKKLFVVVAALATAFATAVPAIGAADDAL